MWTEAELQGEQFAAGCPAVQIARALRAFAAGASLAEPVLSFYGQLESMTEEARIRTQGPETRCMLQPPHVFVKTR